MIASALNKGKNAGRKKPVTFYFRWNKEEVENAREQYKSIIQWWISSSHFWSFLSLQLFSLIEIDPTTISTPLCTALTLPLSTLSAVRSKSEKHVSLGGVIGWNNNILTERKNARERENIEDVSNRPNNGLSKSDTHKQAQSMIDKCISQNLPEKYFDVSMTNPSLSQVHSTTEKLTSALHLRCELIKELKILSKKIFMLFLYEPLKRLSCHSFDIRV